VVESPVMRLLAKYNLNIRDVFGSAQKLRRKMEERSLPRTLAKRFEKDEATLKKLLAGYAAQLNRLDKTLEGSLSTGQRKILYQFQKLKGKAARAEDARTGVVSRHERIILDSLYPHHGLQERSLCALPLFAEYGPDLLDIFAKYSCPPESSTKTPVGSSPCAFQHHVLFL